MTLRKEPHVARVLVPSADQSPVELDDASKLEWVMPDFIRADAEAKPVLLTRGHEAYSRVASIGKSDWRCVDEISVPNRTESVDKIGGLLQLAALPRAS